MADKYLYIDTATGRIKEKATNATSAGAGDAGKVPSLDSSGRLDTTFMPVGIGADTATIVASEALSAGDFVNIWNSTGVKVRKADATTSGKEANGFVLASVSSSANATVYFEGQNTSLTSLTVGDNYYLGTTAGLVTTTPPSGSGNVIQLLGVAISATTIPFTAQQGLGVILA